MNEPQNAEAERLVLPLYEETVAFEKRHIPGATVRVARETTTRDVQVTTPRAQERAVVEHVPVGRYVETIPPVREEGDTTIIPVIVEEVVVTYRYLLKEEVRVRRERKVEQLHETVTLREQHAVVTRIESEPAAFAGASDGRSTKDQETPRSQYMSDETIVAVYHTVADADAAVADLRAAQVPESSISRHDSASRGMTGTTTETTLGTDTTAGEGGGFWSRLFGSETSYEHTDASVYDRSMQEGAAVVTVRTVPGHDVDAVARILESHNPIDIDERASGYGLTAGSTATSAAPIAMGSSTGASTGYTASTTGTSTGTTGLGATGLGTGDRVQLAEESLAVGKRVVNLGGTRVRRYVVETPVEESVNLHSEKVVLERHPVTDGRPVTDADFTDKTIEMTESAEEAVVSKTARVVEEVSLRKEATDRVETVRDTIRKEEVEIEQVPGNTNVSGTTTTNPRTGTGRI